MTILSKEHSTVARTAHFTLQGKGGVGKSYVSSLLVQYHRASQQPCIAVDTDPVNATLYGYSAFSTRRIELMDGSTLVERRFDELIEEIVTQDTNYVVDNGAASFIPLANYLLENDAISVITSNGKRVVVHTVITGGQALRDTLQGFQQLAEQLPQQVSLFVWLNEYFGEIVADGKGFEEMRVYERYRSRLAGLVRIPRQTSSTFGMDVETMLHKKLTFDEVATSPEFGLMAKQRLATVRRAIFAQLDSVL
jgi:hypothetical protein